LYKKTHRLGLSIAELLVATGLMAIVLVTVMTLFGQLLKNTEKNALLAAGSFFADKVLEEQIGRATERAESLRGTPNANNTPVFQLPGYTGSGDHFTIESAEGYLANGEDRAAGDSSGTRYLYRVEAEQVEGFGGAKPGQLWHVEVQVRWWQDSTSGTSATRSGSGKLEVVRDRMAYFGVR